MKQQKISERVDYYINKIKLVKENKYDFIVSAGATPIFITLVSTMDKRLSNPMIRKMIKDYDKRCLGCKQKFLDNETINTSIQELIKQLKPNKIQELIRTKKEDCSKIWQSNPDFARCYSMSKLLFCKDYLNYIKNNDPQQVCKGFMPKNDCVELFSNNLDDLESQVIYLISILKNKNVVKFPIQRMKRLI